MHPIRRTPDAVAAQTHPEPYSEPNGNKDNVIEMAPRLSEDSLLKDSLGVLMQALADERESRRDDRELNRALIAKLSNGNSNKWTIQAAAAVIGVVLVVGAYVVGIAQSNQALIKDVQFLTLRDNDRLEYIKRLEDRLALAEVQTQTLREDLYGSGILKKDSTKKR